MRKFGDNLRIYPICSESYGVRSFCIQVSTPDLSILLDPGCALGPYKKFKIPHYLEFDRLHYYSTEIVKRSADCDFLFISHYHHDHFKPNIEDDMYIHSSGKLFESLYTNKFVFCKQYSKNTNYNQKMRGVKFHKDLSALGISSNRIDVDSYPADKSIYQRNCALELQKEITDSISIGDTQLIFPREFLHGMRMDGKQIKIQPIIIIYQNEFFYFFPDVQGMPSPDDLELLFNLKQGFKQTYFNYSGNSKITHTIAFGGPITYLLRHQKVYHLLEQSLDHSKRIFQEFDNVIVDHHLIRDSEFPYYLNDFSKENTNWNLFNKNLLSELQEKRKIPLVLEINREELYKKVKNRKE